MRFRISGAAGVALAAMVFAAAVVAESVLLEVRMVPIDRLAKNLEALVAKDPGNVQLRINLARAHAMAYALKKSELPVATSLENQGAHFDWGTTKQSRSRTLPTPRPRR